MHCKHTEVVAHDLKTKYQGLGVATLRKLYDFACTTPPLSPPTMCTSKATDVITLTTKYFQQYCRERQLNDPIPKSLLFEDSGVRNIEASDLVEVRKQSVHFHDADSATIALTDEDTLLLERLGLDQPCKVRIRARNHDAPEMNVSVRLYKQNPETGNRMIALFARHLGLEALRFLRALVWKTPRLALHIQAGYEVERDAYGRCLLDFVLCSDSDAQFRNLSYEMARAGHTLSYYTRDGIERNMDAAMRDAIENHRGMFNLPGEVFAFPYRPWDIRHLWNENAEEYAQYTAIRSVPEQAPAVAWQPCSSTSFPSNVNEDSERNCGDNYFFRFVECSLQKEALCYRAPSMIVAAGDGLFVRPHNSVIRKGEHLCLYSHAATTAAEIEQSDSSAVYAIFVSRSSLWFDAEHFDGINLGRFANQPHVLESLESIRNKSTVGCPPLTEEDWRNEETSIDELCNCEFKCEKRQLVLVAKHDMGPSRRPQELLINYGGLRSYWLPLIIKKRDDPNFPQALKDLVHWFLESEQCNWTEEQKRSWAT